MKKPTTKDKDSTEESGKTYSHASTPEQTLALIKLKQDFISARAAERQRRLDSLSKRKPG